MDECGFKLLFSGAQTPVPPAATLSVQKTLVADASLSLQKIIADRS